MDQIGPVSVSFLIHLAFVMVVGGVVVIEQVIPKASFKASVLGEIVDQPVDRMEEPDETLPDPGAEAAPELPMMETTEQRAAPENSMDVMSVNTSVSSTAWMVTTSPVIGSLGKVASGRGDGTAASGIGKGPRMKNPFGDLNPTSGSLQGRFYDLKQTPDRQPSGMVRAKYFDVVREFERKDWSTKVLEPFYSVAQPVYATQFFIPLQSAQGAPKAFNVEKEVQPSLWLILYEGTFRAPVAERYRFVGYGDDILLVRVDGETVLDGSRAVMRNEDGGQIPLTKLAKQTVEQTHKAGNGCLIYGKWLNLDPAKPQKIQVLLGERPGGDFCAFLMIEAKSKAYEKDGSGRPILPLFQMAETDLTFDAEIKQGLAPGYSKEMILMGADK